MNPYNNLNLKIDLDNNSTFLLKRIQGKNILVIGGAGSIGISYIKKILEYKPAKITIIDTNENGLTELTRDLRSSNLLDYNPEYKTYPVNLLSDTFDKIFRLNAWDVVANFSAHKHVRTEKDGISVEALIKNNVFGIIKVLKLCEENPPKFFFSVSTDKAANPVNVMGASKRFTEICLQSLQDFSLQSSKDKKKTKMCMVRFGNALDSSGSVIPLFKKQIQDGGPITLTDKNVTRYFMTIPEAAQLVLQAGSMAEGGDVFVLDMDKSVKIIDLAKRMIKLSGLTLKDKNNLDGDIEIKEVGLSKGEKLYEELLLGEDPQRPHQSNVALPQQRSPRAKGSSCMNSNSKLGVA